MKHISKEHRGSIYAILSGLLYGLLGYFGVSIMRESLSVTNMLFWRFLLASLVIGLFMVLSRQQITRGFYRDMAVAFFNGALFYGLSAMLYFMACPYIGSGLAMVIFFTFPVWVTLFNFALYKQKIAGTYYLVLFAMVAGLFFLMDFHDMALNLMGILLSLASALAYAFYIVSSKKIVSLPSSVATLMVCLGCALAFLCYSLVNNSLSLPSSFMVWRNILGIAILSTAIPIVLLLRSLNYINSEKAAILSVMEPVSVVIFGVILLHEPMKLQYVAGIGIILGAAMLTLFHKKKIIFPGKFP